MKENKLLKFWRLISVTLLDLIPARHDMVFIFLILEWMRQRTTSEFELNRFQDSYLLEMVTDNGNDGFISPAFLCILTISYGNFLILYEYYSCKVVLYAGSGCQTVIVRYRLFPFCIFVTLICATVFTLTLFRYYINLFI